MNNRAAIQRAYVRRLRHRLLVQFGGKCENPVCQCQEHLEFAHKDHSQGDVHGRGRGSARRYLDVQKHPELYKLLCRTCHLIFDDHIDQIDGHYMDKTTQQELDFLREIEFDHTNNPYPPDYFKI